MNFEGKSCSKTILVNVYPTDNPSDKKSMFAIIDDQSSITLAHSDFFNMFDIPTDSVTYTLSSCSGSVHLVGDVHQTLPWNQFQKEVRSIYIQ